MRVRLAATAGIAAVAMALTGCGDSGSDEGGDGDSASPGGSACSSPDNNGGDGDGDAAAGESEGQGEGESEGAAGGGGGGSTTEAIEKAILPSAEDLQGAGLTTEGPDFADFCEDEPDGCEKVTSNHGNLFHDGAYEVVASFQVLVHDSAEDALATMPLVEEDITGDDFVPGPLTPGGDDGSSYVWDDGQGTTTYATIIQQGPYLGLLSHAGDTPAMADTSLSDALNAMLAERMAQAEAGEQPTATLEAAE